MTEMMILERSLSSSSYFRRQISLVKCRYTTIISTFLIPEILAEEYKRNDAQVQTQLGAPL